MPRKIDGEWLMKLARSRDEWHIKALILAKMLANNGTDVAAILAMTKYEAATHLIGHAAKLPKRVNAWQLVSVEWDESAASFVCRCGETVQVSDEAETCECGRVYRLRQILLMEDGENI